MTLGWAMTSWMLSTSSHVWLLATQQTAVRQVSLSLTILWIWHQKSGPKKPKKKKKKQKMVLHQTKELQDNTAKETINRIKWQFLEWEKIFADLMSDKGLIFKLYKKSFNSIATTTKKLIKKWQMTWADISLTNSCKGSVGTHKGAQHH